LGLTVTSILHKSAQIRHLIRHPCGDSHNIRSTVDEIKAFSILLRRCRETALAHNQTKPAHELTSTRRQGEMASMFPSGLTGTQDTLCRFLNLRYCLMIERKVTHGLGKIIWSDEEHV